MIDYLIMLLSTDWFLPYWPEIGIEIDEVKKAGIIQGCREIVCRMLSGVDDYYQISFAPERHQGTKLEFETLLQHLGAEPEVWATYLEWANDSHEKRMPASFWMLHTTSLVSGSMPADPPPLDFSIRAEVTELWKDYDLDSSRFSGICLASRSSWDTYSRGLLSDEPDMLATILWGFLIGRSFKAFWFKLQDRLTEQQLQELTAWYRAMTISRLGEDRVDLVPSYVNQLSADA